ncbi:hypothetical protein BC833DRAFT_623604 [Globomyces pollinis-pini]|nr:hypothetical protein BC833DRAFT_623604 [Globomyces pollinis-pini]
MFLNIIKVVEIPIAFYVCYTFLRKTNTILKVTVNSILTAWILNILNIFIYNLLSLFKVNFNCSDYSNITWCDWKTQLIGRWSDYLILFSLYAGLFACFQSFYILKWNQSWNSQALFYTILASITLPFLQMFSLLGSDFGESLNFNGLYLLVVVCITLISFILFLTIKSLQQPQYHTIEDKVLTQGHSKLPNSTALISLVSLLNFLLNYHAFFQPMILQLGFDVGFGVLVGLDFLRLGALSILALYAKKFD